MVVMRTSTTFYVGFITSVPSTTSVILVGDNLPSSNQASFDTIQMIPSTPTGSVISLANLRMMRTGQQIKLEIESTATTEIEPMETIGLRGFNQNSTPDRNKIVYALSGTNLYLNKGSALSTYGTLTIRYPRVPYRVAADTDYIDLPDGVAVQLGIMTLSNLISRRANIQVNDATKQEVLTLVQSLNQMFGKEFSLQETKQKALALT